MVRKNEGKLLIKMDASLAGDRKEPDSSREELTMLVQLMKQISIKIDVIYRKVMHIQKVVGDEVPTVAFENIKEESCVNESEESEVMKYNSISEGFN